MAEPLTHRCALESAHPVRELADILDGPTRLVLVGRLVREAALVTEQPGDPRRRSAHG